jgi:hypothetical protein
MKPCRPPRPFDLSPEQEEQEWHQEGDADQAPEVAVAPLPPEYVLELVKRHALVQDLVLRDLAVGVEFLHPLGVGKRWQRAVDRFPFGDRQARSREPREAADNHHQRDERADGKEPDRQRAS